MRIIRDFFALIGKVVVTTIVSLALTFIVILLVVLGITNALIH